MVVTTTLASSNTILPTPHNSSASLSSSNPQSLHFFPINRRELVTSLFITISPFFAAPQVNNPTNANPFSLPLSEARGLFQMPPVRLTNRLVVYTYRFLDSMPLYRLILWEILYVEQESLTVHEIAILKEL